MDKGKVRLGRFDKWGYKNSFSKGELARELVYTNEDNDNLKQALNDIREYINNTTTMIVVGKPMKLSEETSGKDILQIIDKVLGDE